MSNCDEAECQLAGQYSRRGSLDDEDQHEIEKDVGPNDGSHFVVTTRTKGVASEVKFIQCTYLMLEDCSEDHPDVISWSREGNAIEVKDIDTLESTIFPRYYNSTKYSSFVRQLNKYDFTRRKPEVTRKAAADTGSEKKVRDLFEHEFFRKGQRELLPNIKRKEVQGGVKAVSNDEEVLALKDRVAALEEDQSEMHKTISYLKEAMKQNAYMPQISQQGTPRPDPLQRLEHRLKSVESSLFTLMNQQRSSRQPALASSWPARDPQYALSHHSFGDPDQYPPAFLGHPSNPPPHVHGGHELDLDEDMKDFHSFASASATKPIAREETFDAKIKNLHLDNMEEDVDRSEGV